MTAARIRAALVNDTRSDQHFGCLRVIDTIERLASENGIDIVERVPVHCDWREDGRAEALARTQLIIVNGEGTIHHDRPTGCNLVSVGAFARDNGVPAALINASWHANSTELAMCARSFTRIAVRERKSAAELLAHGVEAVTMPDLSIHYLEWNEGRRNGRLVGDSVIPEAARSLAALRLRFGGRPFSIMTRQGIARTLLASARVAGVRGQATSIGALSRATATAVDLFRAQYRSSNAFIAAIANAELLVTGRFHGAMIALGLGTPILAVESNTPKIGATLADAGLNSERCVSQFDGIDRARLGDLARWQPSELESLRTWLADGRRAQTDLFRDLRRLV